VLLKATAGVTQLGNLKSHVIRPESAIDMILYARDQTSRQYQYLVVSTIRSEVRATPAI
jgi:hypothetical protein